MGNPFGNGSGGTKSALTTASADCPAQKSADSESAINPKSVPAGGKDTKADPGPKSTGEGYASGTDGVNKKPFKLGK